MGEHEFLETLSVWTNEVLIWVGFGTLAGLLAKAIMPGRDPGGAIVTVSMGTGGSVIGGGVLLFFHEGLRIKPISPLGFVVAVVGALILLFFYRLFSGRFFLEGNQVAPRPYYRRRTASRRRSTADHLPLD